MEGIHVLNIVSRIYEMNICFFRLLNKSSEMIFVSHFPVAVFSNHTAGRGHCIRGLSLNSQHV